MVSPTDWPDLEGPSYLLRSATIHRGWTDRRWTDRRTRTQGQEPGVSTADAQVHTVGLRVLAVLVLAGVERCDGLGDGLARLGGTIVLARAEGAKVACTLLRLNERARNATTRGAEASTAHGRDGSEEQKQ